MKRASEDSNINLFLDFFPYFISAIRGGGTFGWAKVPKHPPPGRSVSIL